MAKVYINGRFLAQPGTGVQRFAAEVVSALDRLFAERQSEFSCCMLVPRNVGQTPEYQAIRVRHFGRLRGVLWEQIDLPKAAADGVLLNLGSTGPLMHGRQLVTVHDASVFRFPQNFSRSFVLWYRLLIPLLGRRAMRVLTVSEFSKRELAECARVPIDKLVVTSNAATHILRADPVDRILRDNDLLPRGYLLFVGGDTPNKNIALLLRALRHLPSLNMPVALVGEADPAVFPVSHRAQNAAIRTLGRVSDGELRALYTHAFCLVFPSLYEGFGIPPLEAMLCGCPVIASNTSAVPDTCGDAAIYCDPHEPEQLAACIQRLLDDADERTRLIEAGYARARHYTWDRCAIMVLDQINELLTD